MGVKLAVIILLVAMTQAKVPKPKGQAVQRAPDDFPDVFWIKNQHCESLADNFCDQQGPKSCTNFRKYCSLILSNMGKVKGLSVDVRQLWDFAFYMLNGFLPLIGKGNDIVPLRRAENQSYEPKDFTSPNYCPKLCPYIDLPVCGGLLYFFERKTYDNECDMKAAACDERKPIIKVKDGEC